MLPEARKCKRIVTWGGDFGLDQYISWNLSSKDLTLEVIWKTFEEFCKPQVNELRARFDLLTSFRQADMSVDEWYHAVQTQVELATNPKETAEILQRDIFWFFLKDESFVSKTLNEGHVELSRFPASTVYQLAKKIESSQATAKHMKKVTRDPQAVQVNLLRHQHTEIPPSKSKRKNKTSKFRQEANKFYNEKSRNPQENKRRSDHEHTRPDRCTKCGDSIHREGFRYSASKYQCKICHKFGHFSSLCYKKREKYENHKKSFGSPKAHQLKIESVQTQDALSSQSEEY